MKFMDAFKPINFGKEYVEINESTQYPMFVATALGLKPAYDDWVDVNKYNVFVTMCKKYKLSVVPDVVFTEPSKQKKNIIGGKNITTTFTQIKPFNKKIQQGNVHVFVAKSKEKAKETKRFGWYPGIINQRSINKPFIDHLRFGQALGFPKCCITFFSKYNNWDLYSHPFESYKSTLNKDIDVFGSYYCNNFLMDHTFFYIHHLPCSYRCEETIKLAKEVENKLLEVEPEFVKITKKLLMMPLLVIGERNFIIFDGLKKGNQIEYKTSEYISNIAKPEEMIDFYGEVCQGNRIVESENKIYIMKDDCLIKKIKKNKSWFLIGFG